MISLLPTLSRAKIVSVLTSGTTISVPKYLELGQGTQSALPSDETTSVPISTASGLYGRITCTVQASTTTTKNDTFQVTGNFVASQKTSITNIGLFDVATNPPRGILTAPVYTSDTQIQVSGYGNFPNSSWPFDIQIGSEVMTVTSGNGTNIWNVTRGSNGSPITYTGIPSMSQIYGGLNTTNGSMFFKSSFSNISLAAGESIQFIINVQFV